MKRALLMCALVVFAVLQAVAQSRTVSGRVTDAKDHSPVAFATVQIVGTKKGTTTDALGAFTIAAENGQKLRVSSVGYDGKEVVITDGNVAITLETSSRVLNEFIATGYTQVDRKKITSAVSEVSAGKINDKPVVDINQTLQGQAAGVFVGSASGQPGSVQVLRIRGIGSINAGSAPLYVLDGVIIEGRDVYGASNLGIQSNDLLANLNPNDVESVNVLKDAAATALYGSRGSNGVIVITTKKGKNGVTTFSAHGQYGTAKASFGKWDLMTPSQAYKYDRDVLAINGESQADIDAEFPDSLLNSQFNWRKAAFRSAASQDYGISASGGNDKTKFFLSGDYADQEGTVIYSGLKRYSATSTISQKVNDRIDIGMNLNLSYVDTRSAGSGSNFSSPILGSFLTSPFQSPYKPDGTMYSGLESNYNSYTADNFLYSVPRNPNVSGTFRGIGSVNASYKIFDWLKISDKVAADLSFGTLSLFKDPTTGDGYNYAVPANSGEVYNQNVRNRMVDNQVSASGNININKDNSLDYIAVMEYQKFYSDNFSADGLGLNSGKLKVLDVTATPSSVGGNNTSHSLLSYLGQLNYSYKSRYNLSASIRRDGSSRFGVNNRYGTFYSFGGSWRVIDESFMRGQKVFSDLRLRGSYGVTGNQDFSDFTAVALYSYSAPYNGVSGSAPNTIGNKNLSWEKNNASDIGVEMGFLDNRLNVTADVYKRISNQLLLNVPVTATSGFTTQQANAGKMQNQGIELGINSRNVQTPSGFTWTTDVNLAMNRNKVLALYQNQPITGSISITKVGAHYSSWYLAKWAGVDPETGKGLFYKADGTKTDTLNKAQRDIRGNSEPKLMGGITNTFSYKGFSLSVFFYGVTGNKSLNQTRILGDADGTYFGYNYNKQAGENYWRQKGDIAERPKPMVGGNGNAASIQSTRFLEDGAFLRLKNITLAYNLPKSVLQHAKLGDVKIYAQASNIFTWTKFTGMDPEQDISANEFFKYPPSKSITFGINVNF